MNPKALKYSEIFSFLAFIFVILLVLTRLDLLRSQRSTSELENQLAETKEKAEKAEEVPRLQQELVQAKTRIASLEQQLEQAEEQQEKIAQLKQDLEKAKEAANEVPDNPPIVILSEQEKTYRFDAGSAEISEEFKQGLEQEIIPFLEKQVEACNCDAIEIVGHTDNVPVEGSVSNLDENLIAAFGDQQMPNLIPGSNVDLGMMRALSIIRYLKEAQADGKLTEIKYFIPYSAGQMLKPNYTLDTSPAITANKRRRRIEMRLLKSTAWQEQVGNRDR